MKRILVIMLSALIILGCCPVIGVSANETATVSVGGNAVAFNIGDTAVYTVELTTSNVIANGQFVLDYSEDVLTVKETSFPVVGDNTMMCNYSTNLNNELRFNFSNRGGVDFTNGGILAQISFEVKAPGYCELVLNKNTMSYLSSGYILIDELPNSVFVEGLSGTTVEPETTPTTEPASETQETQQTETTEPTSDTQETQQTEVTEPASETQETQQTEATEPASETQDTQLTETTEPASETQGTQLTEATEPASETQETQQTETTEPASETQATQLTEATEPASETQATQLTEATEPASETQETKTPTEKTEPTEPASEAISISACSVSCAKSVVYNGKAQKPAVTVKYNGVKLSSADYSVSYKNNTNVGKASVTVKGKGAYKGTKVIYFNITKAKNTAKITFSSKTVKYSKVKKAKQYVKPITVKSPIGKVVYKKLSGSSAFKIDSTGKIAVKKGTKKGKYTLRVKVTVKGNANYKSTEKTVSFKITVK